MTTEFKAKLKELAEGYSFRNGIIKDLGKFQGETIATLFYYDCYLNGGETIFETSAEERKTFGLSERDKFVYLDESNDGYVSLVYFKTQEAAEKYSYEAEGIDIDEIDQFDL